MKKLLLFAALLVVIGVLCAIFFSDNKDEARSDEKPWTVGADYSETTEAQTTEAPPKDAVSAYSDYVHKTLRKTYTFLSEEESYTPEDLQNAILGVYIYDVNADGAEDLSVVCSREDGVFLDIYSFKNGAVQYADSLRLRLDPMSELDLRLSPEGLAHLSVRLTIFPSGSDRYFCLTAEQSDKLGDYNAYTVVLEYSKGKLSAKNSFRLRQRGGALTLMHTGNKTLLYSSAPQSDTEAAAKYTDLPEAFKTEFGKVGLPAPQMKIENGALTLYKVTPVANAQNVFDLTVENSASLTENGFLQSFILDV